MISLGFFRLFHLPDVVARSFLFSSHASFPPLFWLTNLRSLGAKLTVSNFLLADWLKSQKLVNFGSQKTVCFTLSFPSPPLSSSPLSPSSTSSYFWLLVFFWLGTRIPKYTEIPALLTGRRPRAEAAL